MGRIASGLPERAEPAYSALVLHPFLEPGGERAPLTTPHATGALLGLTAHARPREIAWAAREALAFVARLSHDMMNAPSGTLSLGGGLAGDAHFAGFLSTVTGTRVERAVGGQAGLRGLAAIGARHLLGADDAALQRDWIVPPDAESEPDETVASYAEEKYQLFRGLVDAVAPYWDAMAGLRDRAEAMTERGRT